MAGYWLKLYTEILDDPKYHRLSDDAKLGMVELMLVAKRVNMNGEIPSIEDVAFYTRRSVEWWQPVFEELSQIEYLVSNGTETIIRKFAERQSAVADSERMKQSRIVKHKKEFVSRSSYEPVTKRNGETETETEADTDTEAEAEVKSAIPTPGLYSGDDFVIQVFSRVTGMTSIPRNDPAAYVAIDGLRTKYTTLDSMVTYLRPFYDSWITRRGKDGRFFSKTNLAWLTDWAVGGEIPVVVAPPKTTQEKNKEVLSRILGSKSEVING